MPKQAPPPTKNSLPAISSGHVLSAAIFLSGASWLVFELVWSRYLALIFGASVFAVTSVLACFMLGMALGSWLLGRRVDAPGNSDRWLVWLNLAIGVYGLLSPLVFMGMARLNVFIFSNLDAAPDLKNGLRFFLSFLVLSVPTFAMGGTFPVTVKLITRRVDSVGRDSSYVYWVSTLGGALGAFLSGFVLIRSLGLGGTTLLASLAALFAAGLVWFSLRGSTPAKGAENKAKTRAQGRDVPGSPGLRPLLLVVFALSGFTSLAYEVFFTRILTLFFRDSVYDFAIVLTTFLSGLALGSLACGKILERSRRPWLVLAAAETLVGFCALLSLGLVSRLPYLASSLQSMPALYSQYGDGYWAAVTAIKFGYAFAALLLPTVFLGMAFPLVSRIWVRDIDRLGRDLGSISGVNTLGSMLGALLAGFVFISWVGTQNSIVLMALVNIGLGLLLLAASDVSRKYIALAAVVLATCVALLLVPPWDKLRMSTFILEPDQQVEDSLDLLYYNEDAYGIISVVEVIPLQTKILTTNRLYSQNTSVMLGMEDHRRLGYIPLLLHPRPRNVLVVGLGAGITLRGVSEYPGLESIEDVEISAGVEKAAAYFPVENNRILENPKIDFVIEDGRNFISTSRRSYDVIIADIFFPMSSGSSAVFSREHFEATRAHLNPGGLMVQWLPVHQLSLDEIKIIMRTFQSVFPHTSLWYGMIGDSTPVIGLAGGEQKLQIDLAALEAAYKDPGFAKNLQETNLDDPAILLSNFIAAEDVLGRFTDGQPVNSDDRPVIEFSNPLLYERFKARARENMLSAYGLGEDVLPYIRPAGHTAADLGQVRAQVERIRLEIKEIISNFDVDS